LFLQPVRSRKRHPPRALPLRLTRHLLREEIEVLRAGEQIEATRATKGLQTEAARAMVVPPVAP
jgi:hypothetical protein